MGGAVCNFGILLSVEKSEFVLSLIMERRLGYLNENKCKVLKLS